MSSYRLLLCLLFTSDVLSGCSDAPRAREGEPTADDYDREEDMMLTMLRRVYKDAYVPGAARDHTLMGPGIEGGVLQRAPRESRAHRP
jgi:hypothetical protein